MNILITGSSGFVGTYLCNRFRQTHDVFEFDLPFDIRDPSNVLTKVNSDIDAVIHLAAQVRIDKAIEDPLTTFNINVKGTELILEAMRLIDIPKLLFASSSDIYGSAQYTPIDEKHPLGSTNPYGASKIAAERLCYAYGETYGISVGILRCFNIYGDGQKAGVVPIFINRAIRGEPLVIHGDGSQCRDYVYIDDIVEAYDLMLHKDVKDAVNFGSGVSTSTKTIAENVLCVTGSLSKIEYTGGEERPTMTLVANRDRARDLGWVPIMYPRDGIQKIVEGFK